MAKQYERKLEYLRREEELIREEELEAEALLSSNQPIVQPDQVHLSPGVLQSSSHWSRPRFFSSLTRYNKPDLEAPRASCEFAA